MNMDLDAATKEAPTLTLDPFAEAKAEIVEKKPEELVEEQAVPEMELTPEEQKMVDDFAGQIDLTNTQAVLQYGAGSQKKIADFSETALSNVRTKDMGEVGQLLTDVVAQLKDFDTEEDKGFFGLFKKSGDKLSNLKAKYDKAEVNISKICDAMENHQVVLLKDVAVLDKLYQLNLNYFKELSMYILAGKKKLTQAKNVELPELLEKAQKSGLPEDTQAAKDFAAMCERFEKKIYDLELTRAISLQMAPQIRLIQSNDIAMSEKIQSTLVNTIPLWKSQMVIALGLEHSRQAVEAQRAVTNMTNELLKKNAELLHSSTVAVAEESERGIVDIETLTETNEKLIATMDDVLRIQREGHEKRVAAEAQMAKIESDLRKKLVDVTGLGGSAAK